MQREFTLSFKDAKQLELLYRHAKACNQTPQEWLVTAIRRAITEQELLEPKWYKDNS